MPDRVGAFAGAFAAAMLVWASSLASSAGAQESPPSPPPSPGFRPRVVRDGTLSLGVQGQYGTLFAGSGFTDLYNHGPSLGVRVRYRFGEDQAIGASFESQRYDAKDDPTGPLEPKWLESITTTVEYYQYFRTRKRTPQYLLLGAGLLQTRRHLEDDEVEFPGDGGVLTLGAGTEYWWRRTLTFDLSVRYYGFLKGENGSTHVSHGVQAGLGLHYYTSK